MLRPEQLHDARLGPISSPRARRASVRALCRRKISTSIHDRASRWRTSGSSSTPRVGARPRSADPSRARGAPAPSTRTSAPRSLASVVFVTRQPSCSGPMQVLDRDLDVVEEDLVELALARDLAQRADRRRPSPSSGSRASRCPCGWARSGSVRTSAMAQFGERARTTTTPSARSRRRRRRASRRAS